MNHVCELVVFLCSLPPCSDVLLSAFTTLQLLRKLGMLSFIVASCAALPCRGLPGLTCGRCWSAVGGRVLSSLDWVSGRSSMPLVLQQVSWAGSWVRGVGGGGFLRLWLATHTPAFTSHWLKPASRASHLRGWRPPLCLWVGRVGKSTLQGATCPVRGGKLGTPGQSAPSG